MVLDVNTIAGFTARSAARWRVSDRNVPPFLSHTAAWLELKLT